MSRSAIILLVGLGVFSADTFAHINCTREHEKYDCGSACQTTCSNLGQPCSIINIKCTDACYCEIGYVRRDNDSSCIPTTQCPHIDEEEEDGSKFPTKK